MIGMDGLRPHSTEEPLRGGAVRGTEQPLAPVDRAGAVAVGPWDPAIRATGSGIRGLDGHPVGEPGVGTRTGRVRDDPAIITVDRRREARPSHPGP